MKTYGFLVGVQVEGDPDLEHIVGKLADSLAFVENIGVVDVESLGEVDVYDSEQVTGAEVV